MCCAIGRAQSAPLECLPEPTRIGSIGSNGVQWSRMELRWPSHGTRARYSDLVLCLNTLSTELSGFHTIRCKSAASPSAVHGKPDLSAQIYSEHKRPMYSILCKKKHTKSPTFLISQREKLFSCSCHPVKVFILQESSQARELSVREHFSAWESEVQSDVWTAQQHSICKSPRFWFWLEKLLAMIRRCDAAEMLPKWLEIRKIWGMKWNFSLRLVSSNLAETSKMILAKSSDSGGPCVWIRSTTGRTHGVWYTHAKEPKKIRKNILWKVYF